MKQEKQDQVDDLVQQATSQPGVPIAQQASTPEKTVSSSPLSLPGDVQKLLDLAKKVKSYQYEHSQSPNLKLLTKTWVKGDRVKVELYQPPRYDPLTYYNTVYFDLSTKYAMGYCEDSLRCRDRQNAAVSVDYQSSRPKLAAEWLSEIDTATVQVLQTQPIDNRPAKRIQYQDDGTAVDMWLDETYGLPLKIVVNYAEPFTVQFSKLIANTVVDETVTEPVKK